MTTFEEKLQYTGWGLYNKFVIGVASACAFCQSTAFMSIPFALPVAGCDLSLQESNLLSIDFSIYLGMAIGGFFLNCAADSIGRKTMIPTTLILMFGSNFACGFSHGYIMIIGCAFLLGSGIAANVNVVKIHLAESLHATDRGFYLVLPDLFWTLGYAMTATCYWLATPNILNSKAADLRLVTWRLMFGLSSVTSIMVACASALLNPSPRYLLFRKKYIEALDNLKQLYTINNCKHHETFELKEHDLHDVINDFGIKNSSLTSSGNCIEQIITVPVQIKSRSALLFNKRYLCITLILTCIKLPSLFGILIINIWLSKMLHFGEERECNLTGIDVSHLEVSHGVNKCSLSATDTLYRDFLMIGFNIFIGQLVLLCVIEKFGRRIPIICGYTLCGIASMSLAYIENFFIIRLIISSIFMATYSLIQSAFNVILVELYPTAVRGSAAGHIHLLAYILCAFINKYLQTPCQYSFIVMGSLMLAASVIAFFLPDVWSRPMVE